MRRWEAARGGRDSENADVTREPTARCCFLPQRLDLQSRAKRLPPAPAQRDPLLGSGGSDSRAGVPYPQGPNPALGLGPPTTPFWLQGQERLRWQHFPKSPYLGPVVVNQLDHLLHHVLAHLTVNISLRGDRILLLKGQKNTNTEGLASLLGPAPLKEWGRGQDGLASHKGHFPLHSEWGVASSQCPSPSPCCS